MPLMSPKLIDLGPVRYKTWKNKTTGEKGREFEFPAGIFAWIAVIALVVAGLGWAVPAIADNGDTPSVTRPDDRGDEQGRGLGEGTEQGGPDGQGTGRGNGDEPSTTSTTLRTGTSTSTTVSQSTTTTSSPGSPSTTTTVVFRPPYIPPTTIPCTCPPPEL